MNICYTKLPLLFQQKGIKQISIIFYTYFKASFSYTVNFKAIQKQWNCVYFIAFNKTVPHMGICITKTAEH